MSYAIYFTAAFTAFPLLCLAVAVHFTLKWHKAVMERDAYDREAQEWAKLYWDLRDDTPARGKDGRFTRRGRRTDMVVSPDRARPG